MAGYFVEVSKMRARDNETMTVAEGKGIEQNGDVVVFKHRPTFPFAGEDRTGPAWFPKVGG